MFYIHVLRIKCEAHAQGDLLRRTLSPSEIISRSFKAKPTAQVGAGSEWHLGNIEVVDPDGLGFAIGRTAAVTSPQFDIENHDFLEEEAMKAPFTIGVFDEKLQACGIIRKSGVSQNSKDIAGKLASLLNAAGVAEQSNVRIVVDPLQNPISFIQSIRSASSVTRFSFTVSRPNPHDVDKLIQQPAEEFTLLIGGEKTTIETIGEDLDIDVIEAATNAAAAVGENAHASIRPEKGARLQRINLSGNPVVEPVDDPGSNSVFSSILHKTRDVYNRVRNLKQ